MASRWITIVFLSLYQAGFLLALDCVPQGMKKVGPEDHTLVHEEILSGDHDTWTTLFVKPGEHFRGISALVKNEDIKPTWLSVQKCFLGDNEWMKIRVRVTNKQVSAPYGHVTVTTDGCKWSCDIAKIRLPKHKVKLFLLAHGSSIWKKSHSPQCHNTTDSDLLPKIDYVCSHKANAKPKIDSAMVFVGVMVTIGVVVVVVALRRMIVRRRLRRATTQRVTPAPPRPVQTHFQAPPYPTNSAQPLSYNAWQPVNPGQPVTWAPNIATREPYPPLECLGERRAPPRIY
ncbi:uncharacterized protein LOC123516866 [Portunus trituberculatus]|uniref:uncharacterized protein LOC123516866 n=1 Tax=Portunus trituberculatus TaxID=210409 RepID=UPI001E1CF0A5|nr:uncharacterized protein LOC123516866 [Portunus trituberculatus]